MRGLRGHRLLTYGRALCGVTLGALTIGALGPSAAAAQEACPAAAVRALVQDQTGTERLPIEGVDIVVTDASGAEVVSGTTDEAGIALLCLESRGAYTVTLVEDTLPDDAEIAGSNEVTLTESTFLTNVKAVNFFTGESGRASLSFWEKLAQRTLDGLRLGLIIAITSVGLSLIFGTTGLTNFAHGEFVTFGGLMVYLFNQTIGLNLFVATLIVIVLGGMFGYLADGVLFAPLRRRGMGLVSQMVVTVGLGILLRNIYLFQFGGDFRFLTDYNSQEAWDLGPVSITPRDFTTMMISLAVVIAVALALQRTLLGKATRAVSDNVDLASATGIDTARVIRLVWVVGVALAALGGVFRGLDEGINPDMGVSLLFLMFAGITLGGLGSAYGALVGGIIVGTFVEVSTLFGVPTELKTVPALIGLIVILLVRPQGIMGQRQRVG
jgi:branched-chain amino acid transport system permease protein